MENLNRTKILVVLYSVNPPIYFSPPFFTKVQDWKHDTTNKMLEGARIEWIAPSEWGDVHIQLFVYLLRITLTQNLLQKDE